MSAPPWKVPWIFFICLMMTFISWKWTLISLYYYILKWTFPYGGLSPYWTFPYGHLSFWTNPYGHWHKRMSVSTTVGKCSISHFTGQCEGETKDEEIRRFLSQHVRDKKQKIVTKNVENLLIQKEKLTLEQRELSAQLNVRIYFMIWMILVNFYFQMFHTIIPFPW